MILFPRGQCEILLKCYVSSIALSLIIFWTLEKPLNSGKRVK